MTQSDMSQRADPSIPANFAAARPAWWRLLHAIKWVLFLLVLALAVRLLAQQFALIDWKTVHFRPLPVVGAVLLLLAVPPVQMLSYRTLLSAYASPPAWRFMPAIAWVPPMGKYLPGASVVGAMYMLRRLGASAAPVVVAQRIVQTCTELTAFLVGLWFYRRYGKVMQPDAQSVPAIKSS